MVRMVSLYQTQTARQRVLCCGEKIHNEIPCQNVQLLERLEEKDRENSFGQPRHSISPETNNTKHIFEKVESSLCGPKAEADLDGKRSQVST